MSRTELSAAGRATPRRAAVRSTTTSTTPSTRPSAAASTTASITVEGDYPPAGRWLIDAARSALRVGVKVGLFATVHGTFADVTGHLDLGSDPIDSRVDVTVGTASLSSGNAHMDALLHGAGVVDSAKNPSIGFVSHAVRPGAIGSWFLDGLLATDGAVLDVTLEMTDPVRQDGALVFRAKGTLPSRDAVRLLSQPGVERVLGRTMGLDLTVVAIPEAG